MGTSSNYISAASNTIVSDEDTTIPLELSVSQDLFNGGALQDVIGTDILFRADNAGNTALLSEIPNGASGITITGYSTRFSGTNFSDTQNDDYQLLNVRINLVDGTSSGRLNLVQKTSTGNLNQYAWEDVPLGNSVLSDSTLVIGESTGASNPTFSIVSNQLQIVETHSLETAYHIEYMTSVGDSTNFLSAGTAVQTTTDNTSIIPLPSDLEIGTNKNGFIVLSSASAANGGSSNEYKGFSRLLLDLETQSVSGAIAVVTGETSSRTVTWAFADYPLIDLRNGTAAVSPILSAAPTIIGDTTANADTIDNPTIYIDANGSLVITRAAAFAAKFSTMYTAEFYQRTGFGSIASSVSVESDNSLFDAGPTDNVDGNGKRIDYQSFNIPASASVGLMQMSWNTIGGSDTNENTGFGFAVIDVEKGTSSGSITFLRATTPDLLTWDAVPLGETFFGATNSAGVALFQSNKTAGNFTDKFVESAKLSQLNNADGSSLLTFTASSNAGTRTFLDYLGNAQVSWLGSEPFTMDGIPTTANLSHGSPVSPGIWELDFSDIESLAYIPEAHTSGLVNLTLSFGATGESESLDLFIQPKADSIALTTTDAAGYIDQAIPVSVATTTSLDSDGSEQQSDVFIMSGLAADVTLSSNTGSVIDNGGGNWEVDVDALSGLVATASTGATSTVTVSTINTDSDDIDQDTSIENGNNGQGVDEIDQQAFTSTFTLSVRELPTVDSVLTNNESPVITGTVTINPDEIFTVTVNNITYTNGDGNLETRADGTWTLTVPTNHSMVDDTYTVDARLNHSNGSLGSDTSVSELVVDLTPPAIPTVISQSTNDTTPAISGSMVLNSDEYFSVQLNGTTYELGDGDLIGNGNGTWTLTPPMPLDEGVYEVTAISRDAAGNFAGDISSAELTIDITPPPAPGVTSQTTPDATPEITGTSAPTTDYTLKVAVNGIEYTAGDGHLTNNGDGTWILQIPQGADLPDSLYQVVASATDSAGNTSVDPGQDELVVDTLAPPSPGVTSLTTNDTTPVIEGVATVGTDELLSVSVNGTTYTAGDGHLQALADDTWTLAIPSNLSEAVYDVTATLTDGAGNTSSDPSSGELLIDTTPPVTPTVVAQSTNNPEPSIEGTAVFGNNEVLTVSVNDVTYTVDDGNLTDNGDGTWILNVTTAIAEGTYDVTTTIMDAAGNFTSDSTAGELLIDTSSPIVPTVNFLTTSEISPVVTGTATLNGSEVLSVSINSEVYTNSDDVLSIDNNGIWSLEVPAELSDGTYEVVASSRDSAGNTSVDTTLMELVVDTTAPAVPTVQLLNTNNQSPTISGTAIVAAGEFLTVMVNGVNYGTADNSLTLSDNGNWDLSIPTVLNDGFYNVTATVEDAAENTATDASSAELIIDTTPPTEPTVFPETTNNVTPIISGTATLLPGEYLTVSVNGTIYSVGDGNLVDNGDGTWTLSLTNTLPETVYTVDARIIDAAGNSSDDLTANELTVDVTPPVIPTIESLITNNKSPVLSGTAIIATGEVLSIDVNGQIYSTSDSTILVNGDGTWSLPITESLVEGVYEVSATMTDPSGNSSTDLTSSELQIDVTVPNIPVVNALNTNDASPIVTGIATLEPGEFLQVVVNGASYGQESAALTVTASGDWELQLPELQDGNYEVMASITDAATNISTDITSLELTIDTIAPTIPQVFTLVTNDVTPVISGVAVVAPDDIFTVNVAGDNYTLGDGFLIIELDGTWNLSLTTPLSEGFHDVTVTVEDWVGNTSKDSSSNEVLVDITPPISPSVVALTTNIINPIISGSAIVGANEELLVTVNGITYTTDDDELILNDDGTWTLDITTELYESVFEVAVVIQDEAGNSSTDTSLNELLIDRTAPAIPTIIPTITNDTTPQIVGSALLGQGETLWLTVNGVSYVAEQNELSINTDGTWTLNIPAPLAEGLYDVDAYIFDIAGNSTSDTSSGELTIDTTPPPAPGVTSQTTQNPTPEIYGTAITSNGEILTVSVNNQNYTEGDGHLINQYDGTWTLVIPEEHALADRLYDVVATTLDLAGNFTHDPGLNELLVDSIAPASPGVTSLTTNDTTPTLHGRADIGSGETLSVTVDGNTYTQGTQLIVIDGVWTLTLPSPLTEGKYDVTATATDSAGNSSSDPSSRELLIDITAPALAAAAPGTIMSHSPTIDGTSDAPDGSQVTLRDSNGVVICQATVIAGTWSCTPSIAFDEGAQRLEATTTDVAGNTRTEHVYFVIPDDFDGDGILNSIESAQDEDNDGISNQLDLDSDNDGIPDSVEGVRDTDGDGSPDYLDLDTDNDGIADIVEVSGEDKDNDFKVDDPIYSDANGLSDDVRLFPYTLVDTDNDKIPDFRDLDSDQDGISDLVESGGIDEDNDGRIDNFTDLNNDGIDDVILMMEPAGIDTDSDGIPNRLDLDADNDGDFDALEAGASQTDENGVINPMRDSDRDGLPDSVDSDYTQGPDTDGDGIDDNYDASFVNGDDTDGDGIIDSADPDANGDGFADNPGNFLITGGVLPDFDNNNVPDVFEFNDGVLRSGLNGRAGCSIAGGSTGWNDPTFLLLILGVFSLYSMRRFKRRSVKNSCSTKPFHGRLNAGALVALAILLMQSNLHASEDFVRTPWIGASVGMSSVRPDASEIRFNVDDDNDTASRGVLGLDITKRLSAELSYSDLGRAQLSSDHYINYQQLGIDALVYGLSNAENRAKRQGLLPFLRIGASAMKNQSDITYERDHTVSLAAGVGVEYAFSNGVAIRADAISFDVDSHFIGLGIVYRAKKHQKDFIETPLLTTVPAITVQPKKPEDLDGNRLILGPVFFDTNASVSQISSQAIIDEVIQVLLDRPALNVEIVGYADTRGTETYNLALSTRRASSVEQKLLQHGISAARISAIGYGETSQFDSNKTAAGLQSNRRVMISIF